jgi:hypothetical protein
MRAPTWTSRGRAWDPSVASSWPRPEPRAGRSPRADLQVPRVIANANGVRDVPTDRRTEIIRAFLAEGLPVEPL